MIFLAQIFRVIFAVLCAAGLIGIALLVFAWLYDRLCSKGWRRAADQQRRTILEIKF